MQLSSSILGLAPPLHHLLPLVRDAGLSAVELSWAQAERDLAAARDRVAALHTLLDEHGLELAGIELSPLTCTSEPQLHEEIVAIRQQMIFAQDMGVSSVSLRTGDRRQQSWGLLFRGLDGVLARAEALGLDLNLANAYGTRVEQLEDVGLLLLKLSHPRLKLLVDTGQFHESVVSPREALLQFGDRMGAIRLGDRKARRAVALGEGETNVPAVIEKLLELNYAGALTLESPPPGERPVEWWDRGRRYVQRLCGR